MNNNMIIKWLQENIQRLFTKSPRFFMIWSIISGALVLITGVPDLINAITGFITIPDLWNAKITLAVAWASRAALLMSLLTTQSKAVATTVDGTIVKQTDVKALPFTAAQESIKVDLLKKDLPEIKDIPVVKQPK